MQIERDAGNLKAAQAHMAKALQLCPESGPLWACAIELETRPQRKSKSYDALKKCPDDAHVFIAVAGCVRDGAAPQHQRLQFEVFVLSTK